MTVLVARVTHWYCPACGLRDVTREAKPHTRYHPCPKLRGISAPLTEEGTKAKMELREREDYVGDEDVYRDPERKRPVMSITRTRDDGTDAWVFAPTARVTIR